LASTGSRRGFERRAVLSALAAAPAGWLLLRPASAAEYTSAAEVFAAIDRHTADVAARLSAFAERLPSVRAFADSALADQGRHRAARARLRQRLGLGPASAPPAPAAAGLSLADLRSAQQALVYAHAEGLPALDDDEAVAQLAQHMNDLARQLTVIDLWIEAEQQRG
jgi:hypothetical protein